LTRRRCGRRLASATQAREAAMIVAIVNFQLPAEVTAEQARTLYAESAPKYRAMKGLVRKYYLWDADQRVGGGVYLWESRAAADAVYTAEWKAYIKARYGKEPVIAYFDAPVIVDNEIGATKVAA
jgi:hypothetical protein